MPSIQFSLLVFRRAEDALRPRETRWPLIRDRASRTQRRNELIVTTRIRKAVGYQLLEIAVRPESGETEVMTGVQARHPGARVCSFYGEAEYSGLFRQSPHDPARHDLEAMVKQPVPMGALRVDGHWTVLVSDHPARHENATTQSIDPTDRSITLMSGDPGTAMANESGFDFRVRLHACSPQRPHVFRVLLLESSAPDLGVLRQGVFEAISKEWDGPREPFGALFHAPNFMHLRRNETGASRFWIIPGIEYANKQYTRDAFWQSLVLNLEQQQEVYDAVVPSATGMRRTPCFTWPGVCGSRKGVGSPTGAACRMPWLIWATDAMETVSMRPGWVGALIGV
jgi:hypothetical protein